MRRVLRAEKCAREEAIFRSGRGQAVEVNLQTQWKLQKKVKWGVCVQASNNDQQKK